MMDGFAAITFAHSAIELMRSRLTPMMSSFAKPACAAGLLFDAINLNAFRPVFQLGRRSTSRPQRRGDHFGAGGAAVLNPA